MANRAIPSIPAGSLTKTKYELFWGRDSMRVITTSTFNREVVLRELSEMVVNKKLTTQRRSYKIFVTEANGEKELYLWSSIPEHFKFMKSLCRPEKSI